MAYGARQIYPNDLIEGTAIGFNLPINGEAVFSSNFQTKDTIKNNLINFLLTNPGERPSNPEYGGGLRKFIFTQLEAKNLDFLKEDIQEKINQNFSNIQLLEVKILEDLNTSSIIVQIYYSIPNTGINDQLELNFN